MSKLLAERFAEAQSPIVDWEGEPAFAVYEFDRVPEQMVLQFVAAVAAPVQGVRMKIRGGALEINGVESADILLWRDTAPDEVVLRAIKHKGTKTSLKVWNIWRGGSGVPQAWLGNAGMRVEADDRHIRLRCSDGIGPATFDDLEVVLTME